MQIFVNDKQIIFPSQLSDITLGQRIQLQEKHGNDLDKMLESIMKMPDDAEREIELLHWHFEKMFRTFSFFAGTTVEAIKESSFIDEVARIYNLCLAMIFSEENKMEQKSEFWWKEQKWILAPPELKYGDRMQFGEVIDSKQTVKDMLDLGKGKWEAMLRLCVIYLRKPDEEYDKEWLYDDSERLAMMRDLPLDIAMQVGFFLRNSLILFQSTLIFSGNHELKQAASI